MINIRWHSGYHYCTTALNVVHKCTTNIRLCRGYYNYVEYIVIITAMQLHSTKPELGSVQIEILLAVCWRFTIMRISHRVPSWKYG